MSSVRVTFTKKASRCRRRSAGVGDLRDAPDHEDEQQELDEPVATAGQDAPHGGRRVGETISTASRPMASKKLTGLLKMAWATSSGALSLQRVVQAEGGGVGQREAHRQHEQQVEGAEEHDEARVLERGQQRAPAQPLRLGDVGIERAPGGRSWCRRPSAR